MESNQWENNLKFNNAVLFALWKSMENKESKMNALFEYFNAATIGYISTEIDEAFKKTSKRVYFFLAAKWRICRSNESVFQSRHKYWLSSQTCIKVTKKNRSVEHPALPNTAKSTSTQGNQLTDLVQSVGGNTNLLIQAASMSARDEGKHDLAFVLKMLCLCPEKAKLLRRSVSAPILKPTVRRIQKQNEINHTTKVLEMISSDGGIIEENVDGFDDSLCLKLNFELDIENAKIENFN